MIPSCFTYPFVGIRGLCTDAPKSGLYVDSIPGVTVTKFVNVADEVSHTAKEKFLSIHDEAITRVVSDFYSMLGNDFHKDYIIDTDVKGNIGKTFTSTTLTGQHGFKVTRRGGDEYARTKIEYIEFKVNADVPSQKFTITDGCTTKEYCTPLNAGCITKIYTDFITRECEVFVSTDMTDLYFTTDDCASGCNCHYEDCDSCSCGSYYSITGVRDDGGNWVNDSTRTGLKIAVSDICDGEYLVCRLKNEFALAVRYMIANLLMEEVITTERSTPIVRSSQDQAELMIAKIMGGVHPKTGFELKDKLYWKELSKVVKSAKRIIEKEKSQCFSCASNKMRVITSHP